MAYDPGNGRGWCLEPVLVQGVCEDHAEMCHFCGHNPSARGLCPECITTVITENVSAGKVLQKGKACGVCGGEPVFMTPSGSLCEGCGGGVDLVDVQPATSQTVPTPDRPRRSRSADSF